jgi:hypothetical protein
VNAEHFFGLIRQITDGQAGDGVSSSGFTLSWRAARVSRLCMSQGASFLVRTQGPDTPLLAFDIVRLPAPPDMQSS